MIINDQVLANYYEHALFFCFPSLYEGFGIPVLEAFACGCPVLLSSGGSLPEIGGDAAHYFIPTNTDSLIMEANKLLCDESLRKNLVKKGYARLKRFSWDKSYNAHLKIYESVY
jgi:glycosyltransferase involved in cell wall biosynthesis